MLIFLLLLHMGLRCPGQLAPEPIPGSMAGQAEHPSASPEPGLLFYLSGDSEFMADFAAGGQDRPNFLHGVKIIPDGASGPGFQAEDDQLMSYWAPGNILAQRGTLSFFWRSRYPVGPTPFPVFRVGYADHSSWDMTWLRIDYNGSGFDAFVTDVGLSRTRVSHYMDEFPAPDVWTHIAFSWDETVGVRLYVNGTLVEEKSVVGKVYDTGLDQFGPHSRIISPYQVQSLYNFVRGGDLDEVRIYDRMLSGENITGLSQGRDPGEIPLLERDLSQRKWRDAWWDRHGWNLPNDPPPLLTAQKTMVRKVGIHEAYDVKRWMWKANDGIRETTWPGVYNMSRLPGRYDYFVYPDWDCYSMSGQTIRFQLPDEPWNHVEVWGKAWGQLTIEQEQAQDLTFARRTEDQVKSAHRLEKPERGGTLRFDNALIEEPIGELGVYEVREGGAPEGNRSETFMIGGLSKGQQSGGVKEIQAFIQGRYPADERCTLIARPVNQSGGSPVKGNGSGMVPMPFIHLIVPYSASPEHGLDGVEIEIPSLPVKPTHGGVYPMNIRIKDPLWPMRDLADFSFSVRPDSPSTLWFDLRDRILPEDHALYITLAGAGDGLNPENLENLVIRLVYKSAEKAREQHEMDRLTQIRDLFGFMVEERPRTPRLNLFNRFTADQADLMKVNPDHWQGQAYAYASSRDAGDRPAYEIAPCPEGIPPWAFLQVEYLKQLESIFSYYIDHRQVSNGEFGGGLSDDDDFTNQMVGAALMGITPEKISGSLKLFLESYYDQDRDPYDAALRQRSLPLFTNGLSTIHADLLHAYEEGIEGVGQLMLLDYGNPLYLSRGMETARRVLEDLTRKAPDGHRHFRSRYFSGTAISTEDPWQWSGYYSYNMLHTPYLITDYNGNPALQQMIIELADALLDHRDETGNFYTEIHFETGETRGSPGLRGAWQVLLAAFNYTGDSVYLAPVADQVIESVSFDQQEMVDRYTGEITDLGVYNYIFTEGSIWIDRIIARAEDLQRDRLGGIALSRINYIYPAHHVSWRMKDPADYRSLALFLPQASSGRIDVIAYNLEQETVQADMTLWNIRPGRWSVTVGLDRDGDGEMDVEQRKESLYLERGDELTLRFVPREQTIVNLQLTEESSTTYDERPDLAICREAVRITGQKMTVRVYSQGAAAAAASSLMLKDAASQIIKEVPVPAMEAPLDLKPRWVDVQIEIPPGTDLTHGTLRIDPREAIEQITRKNDLVAW